MPKLGFLFEVHAARSDAYKSYDAGATAFVSNGLSDNGVVGYVEPKSGDKVFEARSICVSAFCEATVQEPPFMARGNGGSGLVILEPKKPISRKTLLKIAAYVNEAIRWRFSYGRMVIPDRILHFEIPELNLPLQLDVAQITPKPKPPKLVPTIDVTTSFKSTALTDLFAVQSGNYHKADDLFDGPYPLISCGDKDNGLVRFCTAPLEHIYENCLTVAYNGSPMVTKYHPYKFVAKDDVAVLIPKRTLRATTVLFVQMMLLRETWRYSYGRKCFKNKLMRTVINLPVKDGNLNEDSIQKVITGTSYWDFIQPMIKNAMPIKNDPDSDVVKETAYATP